jgi:hypothetical protein
MTTKEALFVPIIISWPGCASKSYLFERMKKANTKIDKSCAGMTAKKKAVHTHH